MLLGQDFLVPKIDPRVYKEAKTLSDNGYKVILVYLTTNQSKKCVFDKIQLLPLKDNVYLPGFRDKKILIALPKIAWGALINLIHFLKTTKNMDFDVVHCHDVDTLIIGLIIKLRKFNRVKLIYDSHEIATEMNSFKPFRPLIFLTEKIASFWVDGFITINSMAKEFLTQRYPRLGKISLALKNVPIVLSSPINLKVHQPLRFVYQGSLKKNRLNIIEEIIIQLSQYDHKLWKMEILGDISEIKSDSILFNNPQVIVRNMIIEPKKFYQELTRFDIGIVAMNQDCLNNYFSLPNKVFDYMISSIAVIAPDFPVVNKIINETNTGYLLDSCSSSESIKKTIDFILKNPKAILNKKKNGPIWIKKKYNWNHEEAELLKFYHLLDK